MSPVIMLILSEPPEDSEVALELLEAIVEDCKLCGVLLSVNHASMLDAGKRLPPSICVLVTARHTPSSLAQVTQALVKSWWRVQERARKGLLFP